MSWLVFATLSTAQPPTAAGRPVSGQELLAWIEAERFAEAETVLRQRLARGGGAPPVHFLLGKVLLAQFRFVEAEAELERAVSLRADRDLWYHALATARVEQGRFHAAAAALDQALSLVPRPETHYDRAICALAMGEFDLARAELERALALAPDHPRAHFQLGVLASDLGDDAQARTRLTRALELAPDHLEARYRLGLVHRKLGEPEKAIDLLRPVIEAIPGHAGALYNLALALRAVGQGTEARQRLTEFRRVSRRDDLIDNQLQYLQLHPTAVTPRVDVAKLLLEAGRNEEAREQLEAARRLQPEKAEVHHWLAEAYQRLGQPVAAEQARRAARRLATEPSPNGGPP